MLLCVLILLLVNKLSQKQGRSGSQSDRWYLPPMGRCLLHSLCWGGKERCGPGVRVVFYC